ncbi:hypothetical protein [Thomasclavelia spiroformis]|uniref:hypothetical protein n=1 Tax=Thomasclavelia spiroformis TaxID=29348 RepID=UPI0032097DE5
MEFYSKKRSIGCFDKYIIMISEILSQISEIEYLKINFISNYDRIDLNTISKYMNKYKKYLVVTNDDVLVYYDQDEDDYYYCYYPLIDKLIKNLRDTYSNNTNQNINYEINNKLIDINQKLKKIQEQQILTQHNDSLLIVANQSKDLLKNVSQKIDDLNKNIHFQLNKSNGNDTVKDLCDIIDKIDGLSKKLEDIENDLDSKTNLLREIRNQVKGDAESSEKTIKNINSILGTVTFLKKDIENIKIDSKEVKNESKDEEIEITNPDVELLNQMHETASKLNDLIFKTAIMVAKKEKTTNNETEDINKNLDYLSNENNESKDHHDLNHEETSINDNDQIIIEELKD